MIAALRFVWPAAILLAALLGPKLGGLLRVEDLLALAAVPPLAWHYGKHRDSGARDVTETIYLCLVGYAAVVTIAGITLGWDGRGTWAALTMMRLVEVAVVYAAARVLKPSLTDLARAAQVAAGVLAVWGAWEAWDAYVLSGEFYARSFNEGWFAGESNHVAGALVFIGLLPGVAPLAAVGVLVSGSRTALAALLVTQLRALWLGGHRRAAAGVVLVLILAVVAAPTGYRARLLDVFSQHARYAGPHVERTEAWRVALTESPWWGAGLGARPNAVYESGYVFLYAETGLPGLLLFAALLVAVVAPRPAADTDEERIRSGIGIALAVLSLAANTLIIARIALPAALLLGTLHPRRDSGVLKSSV